MSALVQHLVERLDAMEQSLAALGSIEKQLAALRLEIQSWTATSDAEMQALAGRVRELETAIAGRKQ